LQLKGILTRPDMLGT